MAGGSEGGEGPKAQTESLPDILKRLGKTMDAARERILLDLVAEIVEHHATKKSDQERIALTQRLDHGIERTEIVAAQTVLKMCEAAVKSALADNPHVDKDKLWQRVQAAVRGQKQVQFGENYEFPMNQKESPSGPK